jgi:hypothetical protein
MTRISDLPTLVGLPCTQTFEERMAVLKREIVEAMNSLDGEELDEQLAPLAARARAGTASGVHP